MTPTPNKAAKAVNVFAHILGAVIAVQQHLPDLNNSNKKELAAGLITAAGIGLGESGNSKAALVGLGIDTAVALLKQFGVAGFSPSANQTAIAATR